MPWFNADYSRDLYHLELQALIEYGDPVEVRSRYTMEILNVISEVREPWHHCILIPSRRWNPWLALSEALWILAGRNDVRALKPYNSHISDYSDDGHTLYGAYGPRIYDQIDDLIGRLRKDPSDRRAVLQIWDVKISEAIGTKKNDLTIDSKDPPCLNGDTIVYSPEGNKPISELVGKSIPVYTLNEETKKIEFKWAEGISRGVKQTLTVILDDGSKIRATPDHLFLTKKKSIHTWVKAKDLQQGISIVPIHLISWSNFVSAVVGNHKVTRIEEGIEEEVFDLQVEDNHNFFIAPGILVHNCNNLVYFKLRDNKLNMTVINRSNDIHYGLFAVNLPTFGILQNYIASRLGVDIGIQTHLSNSLHVYTDRKEVCAITERMLLDNPEEMPLYPEHDIAFRDLSWVNNHEDFTDMCSDVLDGRTAHDIRTPSFLLFANNFLRQYRDHVWKPRALDNAYADWIMAGELYISQVWKNV